MLFVITTQRIREATAARLRHLGEQRRVAEEALSSLPPEAQRAARDLHDTLERAWAREVLSGARPERSYFQRAHLTYAERVLTPQARAWLETTGKADDFERFIYGRMRRFTTKDPSQIHRTASFAEEFSAAANEWFAKNREGFDGEWFELDFSKALPQRLASGEVSIANAKLFQSLADELGRPLQPGDVPLEEFLAKAPLYQYRGLALGKDPEQIARQLDQAGLARRGIPREAAAQVFEVAKKLQAPEELQGLGLIYDEFLAVTRFSLTSPFPAFHVRNFLTNVTMNWLGGVARPRFYRLAYQALRDPSERERLLRLGVFKGSLLREMLEQLGRRVPRVIERVPVLGKVAATSARVGGLVEDLARAAHYYGKKAAGLSDLDAVRSVDEWLFDYSKLTDVEKTYGRRLILFYPWARKALPKILATYITDPRKMAALTRATAQPTTERQALPPFLRKTLAIPFGQSATGGDRYLTGLGVPLEEFARFDPFSQTGPGGALRSLTRASASLLSPPLKQFAERAAGEDFYLDREIIDADKAPEFYRSLPRALREALGVREERLPSGDVRVRADPFLLWWLRNSPLSRLQSTADRALDPAKTPLERLITGITGVRTMSVDPERARLDAMRLALESRLEELRREGRVGEFTGFFQKGPEEEQSPQAQLLLRLLRRVSEERERLFRPEVARR